MHDKIYTLYGSFVKDGGMETFDKKVTMHCFILFFQQKTIKFYLCRSEDKESWLKIIKEAIGYSSLYDYYRIEVFISITFL